MWWPRRPENPAPRLGVGEEIIRIAVSAVLGGTALALGLAFGLGGRDKAQQLIDRSGEAL